MKMAKLLAGLSLLALTACAGQEDPPERTASEVPPQVECPPPTAAYNGRCIAPQTPQPNKPPRPFDHNDLYYQAKGYKLCLDGWYENGRYLRQWLPVCPQPENKRIKWRITNGEGRYPNFWVKPKLGHGVDQHMIVAMTADEEAWGRYMRPSFEVFSQILAVRVYPELPMQPTRLEVTRFLAGSEVVACTNDRLKGLWVSRTNRDGTEHDLTFSGSPCQKGEVLFLDRNKIAYLRSSCVNFAGDEADRTRIMEYAREHLE